MVLSFYPEGHPYQPHGFSHLIRVLANLSAFKWLPDLEVLFLLVQSLFLSTFAWVLFYFAHLSFREKKPLLLGMLVVVLIGVFPGLVILSAGYWAGLASLSMVLISSFVLRKADLSLWPSIFLVILFIAGAQLRHQLQILPLALLCVFLVQYVLLKKGRLQILPVLLIAIASFLANQTINRWYDNHYEAHWYASQYIPNQVRMSIQCRLGCDVSLYENICQTPESISLVESTDCTDLLQHRVELGEPNTPKDEVLPILKKVGLAGLVKWLFISPLDYLGETQKSLEIEQYGFNAKFPGLSTEFPQVFTYYDQQFTTKISQPSYIMRGLTEWVEFLYKDIHLFHFLTSVCVVFNFLLIYVARKQPYVLFLVFYSLGSYFLFALFQPQTPFRYLLHVLAPAIWAWMMFFLKDYECWQLQSGSNSAASIIDQR